MMPHIFLMCLGLIGSLFFGILTGLTYTQLNFPNPEKETYYRAQKNLAERFDFEDWAALQRSKTMRRLSFALTLLCLMGAIGLTIWQGFLAFA